MSEHTPGPWSVKRGWVTPDYILDAAGTVLAELTYCDDADAHLMAAAPDLLTACEMLARVVGKYDLDKLHNDAEKALEMAWSAVAKARGK